MKYAEIIVDNRASKLDRPFTYSLNGFSDTVRVGMRVIVPFGNGNKPIKGFIIRIFNELTEEYSVKEIIDILDTEPLVTNNMIELGLWMKEKYLSSYLDSLQQILPPGDYKQINTFVELNNNYKGSNFTENKQKIVDYLKINEISLLDNMKKDIRITNLNFYLKELADENIINIYNDIKATITKKYEKWIKIDDSIDFSHAIEIIGKRAKKQLSIYKYICEIDEIQFNEVIKTLNTNSTTVNSLKDKGLILIFDREVNRTPIKRNISKYNKLTFNPDQLEVYNEIVQSFDKPNKKNFLIHGVTGSGKTEIYLQLVEEMLERKKDSIILVPEISLTPQTIDRFVGRFGDEVAVLHSKLSQGERFDQWRSIREGRVKIVVGARSAIFAPTNNLGLIIIDEEHEDTYKSSQNPKYITKEVALKRNELENATVVLGSATPSVETYYTTLNKKFKLLQLNQRATKSNLPKVKLIDMREQLHLGNRSIFSIELHKEIVKNLENKKQTILFLNRRGFSSFVSCRSCGQVIKCTNCEISMTYHKNINRLRCHYCGKTEEIPSICPECGSKYIKYFGIGTERVEEESRRLFPAAKIVRMDSDTTSAKGSFDSILEDMKDKKIDILIGTQMISKGLDFPDVTLVGIIAADTTLNLPDYRSPEKAFQLITQVAGRAGRGDTPGRVILQTYNPCHYSITSSKNQNYLSFYNTEIKLRKEFMYPPFINLISLLIYGNNYNDVKNVSGKIYDIIKKYFIEKYKDTYKEYLIGPNPAPIERIKNSFRWQIIIKACDYEMGKLKDKLNRVCIIDEYKIKKDGIKISVDINPTNML
ncbi:MAG: primosomal protein N' [Tissierellia bacterium]|nr:primosomal protein N' [Tissierellia bacterium]MDD4725771.1 primosomal protein N' [Tissierellia bacterium]